MNYTISQALAQKILDYLVHRPYGEVAHLIAELRQIQPIQEVTPEVAPEK